MPNSIARQLRVFSTDAERRLWSVLRDRRLAGYKFRRQHPVGGYIADFACIERRLLIELDGGQLPALQPTPRGPVGWNATAGACCGSGTTTC
ncbi:MAG TPA: endonuclease domain-containing protein [Stellaceae bacterium]